MNLFIISPSEIYIFKLELLLINCELIRAPFKHNEHRTCSKCEIIVAIGRWRKHGVFMEKTWSLYGEIMEFL